MPMPIIIYGWIVEKKWVRMSLAAIMCALTLSCQLPSIGGLPLPLVLLAINGFGLMMVLNPGNTYCVDAMQQRSAEVASIVSHLEEKPEF